MLALLLVLALIACDQGDAATPTPDINATVAATVASTIAAVPPPTATPAPIPASPTPDPTGTVTATAPPPTATPAPIPASPTPDPTGTVTATAPPSTATPAPIPASLTPEPTGTVTAAVPPSAATPTPIPASPTPEPTGTVTDLEINIGSYTRWKEIFDTLSAPEQSCIRDALDGESLESALDRLILAGDWEQSEVSIFACLTPGTARSILLSDTVADIEEDAELSEEEMSCLRGLVADIDVAALVAAGEDSAEAAALAVGMITCLPDTFISFGFAEFGLSMEDLSQEEASCLREWVAGAHPATWVAAVDNENYAAALAVGMITCLPDTFISLFMAEFGLSMEDLSQEEASCLREWVAGAHPAAWVAAVDDLNSAAALAVGIITCIPDRVISLFMAEVFGLSMEDLSQEEASCLRERVAGADPAAWFAVSEELFGGMIACLPDTVISLFIAEGFGLSMDDLSQEEASCLREWVTGADPAAWVAAYKVLFGGMIACLPDTVISLFVAEFGLSMEDLSQEDASCLREWVAGAYPAASVAEGEELFGGMIACIPDLL